MTTDIEPAAATDSASDDSAAVPRRASSAPRLFWLAPLVSFGALGAFFGQVFAAGLLVTPWYMPIGGTAAAILAIGTIGRPLRWWRVLVTGGCLLIACMQWVFLLALTALPTYSGQVTSGSKLPSFHANLADGTEISNSYFQQGETTLLVFFQGRWCPFCMTHLRELEAHHDEFDKVSCKPVVVSIEDVETAAQSQRDFPHLTVVSDKRRELAEAVDVINTGFGPDGQDSAAPTILLIDGAGKVLWIHRPTRFISRPSAAELAAKVAKQRMH